MSLPIPDFLWRRMLAFMTDGKTGKIILNIQDGRVISYDISESGRVRDGDLTRLREPAMRG